METRLRMIIQSEDALLDPILRHLIKNKTIDLMIWLRVTRGGSDGGFRRENGVAAKALTPEPASPACGIYIKWNIGILGSRCIT